MSEDHLVTIKTYMFPTEAYGLMTRLEDEGIECYLEGENTVSVHPFLSNAIGGIKLQIKHSDIDKAREIIRKSDNYFKENWQSDPVIPKAYRKDFVRVETFCPECDSMNVFRRKFPLHLTIILIILAPLYIPLAFTTKKHYCADCNHVWKQ